MPQFCEQGNEPLSPIAYGKLLDRLSESELVK
jgi:hypothetical protein